MIEFSIEIITLLIAVSLLAGFIDAVAGGGGLLTIPALLFAGLNPVQALATNKLQASFGSFSATRHFIKKGLVKPSDIKLMIVMVLLGAAAGSYVVQLIDASFLRDVMPIALICIAMYFSFAPAVGETESHQRLSLLSFTLSLILIVSFYDGFFGPGTGTFFALGFVTLLGMNFTRATAHAKVLNFTTNIASLVVFIIGGEVVWAVGLLMAAGQFIGARLGAGMVIKKGTKIIRPLTIIMCVSMSVALLLE